MKASFSWVSESPGRTTIAGRTQPWSMTMALDARVEVLFAQRDIQPGEEVCITYHSFSTVMYANMSDPEEDFKAIQRNLIERGIICRDDCFCKDPGARKLVLKGRRLNTKVKRMAGRDGTLDRLEETAKKLVVIQESLNVTPHLDRCATYLRSCAIAIGRSYDEPNFPGLGITSSSLLRPVKSLGPTPR